MNGMSLLRPAGSCTTYTDPSQHWSSLHQLPAHSWRACRRDIQPQGFQGDAELVHEHGHGHGNQISVPRRPPPGRTLLWPWSELQITDSDFCLYVAAAGYKTCLSLSALRGCLLCFHDKDYSEQLLHVVLGALTAHSIVASPRCYKLLPQMLWGRCTILLLCNPLLLPPRALIQLLKHA